MTDTRSGTTHPINKLRSNTHTRVDRETGLTVEKTFQSPRKISCGCSGVLIPQAKDTAKKEIYVCNQCGKRVTSTSI